VGGGGGGGWGGGGGGVGVFLLLILILFGFAFFAVRTAGFRELVADRWAETLGVRPVIGTSRLSFGGEVVFADVRIMPPEGSPPLLQVAEVRIRWRPDGIHRILLRPVLRVDGRGSALFPALAGLEKVETWEELEEELSGPVPPGRWEVRDGTIEGLDPKGGVRWRVDRIKGNAWRLDIPGREAIYFHLSSADGSGLRSMPGQFPRQWLWVDGGVVRLPGAER